MKNRAAVLLVVSLLAGAVPAEARGQRVEVRSITLGPVTGRLLDGFSWIRSVRELSDGTVIVATGQTKATPLLADFDTKLVEEIGQVGRGPGDFMNASHVYRLGGDSTLVEDGDGGRWTVLNGTQFASASPIWQIGELGRPELAGADTTGRVLEARPSRYGLADRTAQYRFNADSLVVLRHYRARVGAGSAVTGRVDTIAQVRGGYHGSRYVRHALQAPAGQSNPIAGTPTYWWLTSVLAAEEQALLFPDGWIALAFADPYHVEWLAPDGRRVAGPLLPFDTVRVTEQDKLAAVARDWPRSPTMFKPDEYPPWPRILPPFLKDRLIPLPDGRVAIHRTPDVREPGNVYDLVDRTGRLTARLVLRPNETLVGFGKGTVYVNRTDRDDLHWLERHAWPD